GAGLTVRSDEDELADLLCMRDQQRWPGIAKMPRAITVNFRSVFIGAFFRGNPIDTKHRAAGGRRHYAPRYVCDLVAGEMLSTRSQDRNRDPAPTIVAQATKKNLYQ